MGLSAIILAAGQGTRMQSDRPKVLHDLGGAPLVVHALRAAAGLGPDRVVVVVGHGGDQVAPVVQAAAPGATVVTQTERLGTGHAVRCAEGALAGATGDALVLYGDTPFLRAETLVAMRAARAQHAVVVLGFRPADPARYGRLVVQDGLLQRIVEFKDADEATRAITLCNSGVICADVQVLMSLLAEVGHDNAAGEYYLTDIVGLARARGLSAGVVECDEAETLGVDSKAGLARAEALLQARLRDAAMAAGAHLVAPDTVHLAYDTDLGRDVVVDPYVVFGPGVIVAPGARIRAFSHLEQCVVASGAIIGPYARLRPGADVGADAHVGNFVEIKNAVLGPGAKVNHLTYIGDADVGARTNVGAGTVTCNYDGVFKHRTVIGADAFIGSDTMLVAPVTVGDRAMTATGAVITQDVPAGAMAIARARQVNKPGLAVKFMDRLRALKAAKKGH
jgi:bifunctional UDP-N-acetylglucosamine pyrophosphorylase / glucosamine-1-phosphate N-acetyltransferase